MILRDERDDFNLVVSPGVKFSREPQVLWYRSQLELKLSYHHQLKRG